MTDTSKPAVMREKVGAPWPPNLSRLLWAGIAADEKKRADDAEAKLAALDTDALVRAALERSALVADDIMIDMMNAALTGLPEQARLRESMANTAEKIRIRIRALADDPEAKAEIMRKAGWTL